MRANARNPSGQWSVNVGWAKANRPCPSIPRVAPDMMGTLRFAHPTAPVCKIHSVPGVHKMRPICFMTRVLV